MLTSLDCCSFIEKHTDFDHEGVSRKRSWELLLQHRKRFERMQNQESSSSCQSLVHFRSLSFMLLSITRCSIEFCDRTNHCSLPEVSKATITFNNHGDSEQYSILKINPILI